MAKLPIRVKGLKLNDGKLEVETTPARMNVSKRIAQRKSKKVRPTKRVKGAQRP